MPVETLRIAESHIFVAVWEVAVAQMLPCQREGGNVHDVYDSYAVAVVKNNDIPIDNDPPHSMNIFAIKTFANCPETAKFAKFFTHKDSHYTGFRSIVVLFKWGRFKIATCT